METYIYIYIMMTQEEVRHIALLARIGLSDEEVSKYGKDLSTVLAWFEQLKGVDTDQVSAIGHITGRSDVARTDGVVQGASEVREGIVANFPEQKNGYLKVRSVF